MIARTACRLARLTASTVGLYLSATAGLRRVRVRREADRVVISWRAPDRDDVIAQTRRELDALRERGLEHLARNATVQA